MLKKLPDPNTLALKLQRVYVEVEPGTMQLARQFFEGVFGYSFRQANPLSPVAACSILGHPTSDVELCLVEYTGPQIISEATSTENALGYQVTHPDGLRYIVRQLKSWSRAAHTEGHFLDEPDMSEKGAVIFTPFFLKQAIRFYL